MERKRYEGMARCKNAAGCPKAFEDNWHCMLWANCEKFVDDDKLPPQNQASISVRVDLSEKQNGPVRYSHQ